MNIELACLNKLLNKKVKREHLLEGDNNSSKVTQIEGTGKTTLHYKKKCILNLPPTFEYRQVQAPRIVIITSYST